MRKTSLSLVVVFSILLLFITAQVKGQIVVEPLDSVSYEDLVERICGEGIMFTNVEYTGGDSSQALFGNGAAANLGMESGIMLSSGMVTDIYGPNIHAAKSVCLYAPGDADLDLLVEQPTSDAAVLEFDFFATMDTLSVKYIFSSEDYNEWVGGDFNDVCGIFLSGPDPSGGEYESCNFAVVPDSALSPVTVNTVNNGYAPYNQVPDGPCTNCEYFVDNTNGPYLEADARTIVMEASVAIVPFEEYHIKIAVADVYDCLHDAWMFIEEDCIEGKGIEYETILVPPDASENMIEGNIGARLLFRLPDTSFSPTTLYFEVGGTSDPQAFPPGDFEEEIPTEIHFEAGFDTASIWVFPVYDEIIEGSEWLELIVENDLAASYGYVDYDTVKLISEDYYDIVTWNTPDTYICQGQQIELYIFSFGGIPPITHYWEPVGLWGDTISFSPEETTKYYIHTTDYFHFDSVIDSVLVTVFPLNYEIAAFSFESINNPGLPWTVFGEIYEDSISLDVPAGTDITNLVASWEIPDGSWVWVNSVTQENGLTSNDFTEPLIYHVIAPGGCAKEWKISVNLATGSAELPAADIIIHPNPASDQVFIRNAAGYKAEILNGLGKIVLHRSLKSSREAIPTTELNEGIYFLQFSSDQQSFIRKIIIER